MYGFVSICVFDTCGITYLLTYLLAKPSGFTLYYIVLFVVTLLAYILLSTYRVWCLTRDGSRILEWGAACGQF